MNDRAYPCPVCGSRNPVVLELNHGKRLLMKCEEHGLYELNKKGIELTKYPCPRCKGNYKTPLYHKDGYAVCECELHGEYRINVNLSLSFRRLCSLVASKPNKSSSYYTPPELEVKEILESLGLVENRDYRHNPRVKDETRGVYYYPDFLVDSPVKLLIGVNPSIWHSRWHREESDRRKILFFKTRGYKPINLNEKNRKYWSVILERALRR